MNSLEIAIEQHRLHIIISNKILSLLLIIVYYIYLYIISYINLQILNPLLTITNFDWKSLVMDMLNDIPKHIQTYAKVHVAEIPTYQIELRKDEDIIKLKFSLDLVKGTPEQFWENITMPFSLASTELLRRHKILLDLIRQKDEEIAEYKAEGAELIRSMCILSSVHFYYFLSHHKN